MTSSAVSSARAKHAAGEISFEQLREVEDAEVSKIIEKQKAVGLHAVTDGEFRRRWWHLDWLAGFNGIKVYDFKTAGFGVEKVMQSTYVDSPISFDPNHPFLDGFRRTQKLAGDTPVKQTIAGPNMVTLDSVVLSQQYATNPVYANLDELRHDLAKTYQDAIRAFYDAGCRYLQLDDTSWGALFSERFRDRIVACGYDPDELINVFGDITDEALEGRPEDMVITTHMCKGNFMSHWLYEGTYETIARRLLGIRGFDGFFLEYDDERSGRFRTPSVRASPRPRRSCPSSVSASPRSAASPPPRRATRSPSRSSGTSSGSCARSRSPSGTTRTRRSRRGA